jgi:hypothetical protein
LLLTCALSASAQVVSVTEGPLRPYTGPGEIADAHRTDPTPFSRFYVTATMTAPGTLTDAAGATTTVGTGGAFSAFQFPALRFTISVAPRLLAGDPSASDEKSRIGELRRMNAHVTVQALDAAGKIITAGPKGGPVVETLVISPGESSMATAAASNVRSEAKETANVIAGHLGPIGAAVSGFESAFHVTPPPTEVPYQASANEFGWGFFASPGNTIDGLHYTAALLQLPATAASLHLSIELVSDWRKYGACKDGKISRDEYVAWGSKAEPIAGTPKK